MTRALVLIGSRIALVVLTFLIVLLLAHLALAAARTRPEHLPPLEVMGRAWEGTVDYLASLLSGSLGEASSTSLLGGRRRAMGELLADAYVKSMALVVLSIVLAAAAGTAAGVIAAAGGSRRIKAAVLGAATLATSAPSFFLAALLVLLGAEVNARMHIRLWPTFGFGWDDHLILPVLILAARPFAQIALLTLQSMEEVLREDYVRTARARGILESAILWRHALPNAAGPILGAITAAVSIALSTLPVVEVFFSWPGLGFGLLQAIRRFDAATAGTLLGALAVTLAVVRMLLDALSSRVARPARAGG